MKDTQSRSTIKANDFGLILPLDLREMGTSRSTFGDLSVCVYRTLLPLHTHHRKLQGNAK